MEQVDVEVNKQKFHLWSHDEDKLLVECLVTLRLEQKFMADNGFRPGFATALQSMMEEKAPGCGIKANPHIISRIKTLKQSWQTVYDMVYGTNTSGFGWDPDTKCVIAEKDVWDEYLRVHKKATPFRNKPFPHLENLSFVWAKDRAVGEGVRSPLGMEEEVQQEERDAEHDNHEEDEVNPPTDALENPTNTINASHVSATSRKRKRPNNAEMFADVLRETVGSLDQTIVNVIDNLGNRISNKARQDALDAKAEDLYFDLMNVEGLTIKELNDAHIKIVSSPHLLTAFKNIPLDFKASWIRSLLST